MTIFVVESHFYEGGGLYHHSIVGLYSSHKLAKQVAEQFVKGCLGYHPSHAGWNWNEHEDVLVYGVDWDRVTISQWSVNKDG